MLANSEGNVMDEILDELVRNAAFAADRILLDGLIIQCTAAQRTREEIREALKLLIGNGLITVTPRAQWPEYIVLDPPYNFDKLVEKP